MKLKIIMLGVAIMIGTRIATPPLIYITNNIKQSHKMQAEAKTDVITSSVVMAKVTPTPASTPIPPKAVEIAVEEPSPFNMDHDQIVQRLQYWTSFYGISFYWLHRVGMCESSLENGKTDPIAIYSARYGYEHAQGVFQFLPSTFYANASRIGIQNPNIWNADQNIQVAVWMFSQGQSGQWACK